MALLIEMQIIFEWKCILESSYCIVTNAKQILGYTFYWYTA